MPVVSWYLYRFDENLSADWTFLVRVQTVGYVAYEIGDWVWECEAKRPAGGGCVRWYIYLLYWGFASCFGIPLETGATIISVTSLV
jgi:hypothetical protein